ncbi:MAG: protease pro-enzyme activation domain-containing protein [Casimicrobiaceae bacterium]
MFIDRQVVGKFPAFLFGLLCAQALATPVFAVASTAASVALPGHVLPALSRAQRVEVTSKSESTNSGSMSLTVVLRRNDEAGFQRRLADTYDPSSAHYRQFMSSRELADAFGPSQDDYDAVKAFFVAQGFTYVEGSANRMTMTVAAGRTLIEQALKISISDYTIGKREFFANGADPQLPEEIAKRVQAVVGLSNLAQPRPVFSWFRKQPCKEQADTSGYTTQNVLGDAYKACKDAVDTCSPKQKLDAAEYADVLKVCDKFITKSAQKLDAAWFVAKTAASAATIAKALPPGGTAWKDITGAGQKVGLLQFDTFVPSDVSDYLVLFGLPDGTFANLSQVHVNGGATLGADQSEVLLDIDTVMLAAPDAKVVVYDAPFSGGGSFQALFNRAISDGMTIISNSWTYCEDQTTLADVQSIDSILATAAAAGISVFNASGDSGSTCLDGSTNTIGVPAGSPNATAVGGTSLQTGPASTYLSETWWNGVADVPPTGQGGFGVSRFFARPAYQDGLTGAAFRSIPDIAINADPVHGVIICQASLGGCPTPLTFGGTSGSAPAIAAAAAMLNQAMGRKLGNYNLSLYALANTTAFHSAASMGSDFSHVGLGSPNMNKIYLALSSQIAGTADATQSKIDVAHDLVAADGTANTSVVVRLRDADGNPVSGKTVTLVANGGVSTLISPASAITTVANGAAIFTVKDLVAESVTLTATDTTDGVTLQQPIVVTFGVPPAAGASIVASPTSVPPNQSSPATITVTLQDSLNRPTPGKLITLSQGAGHSTVTAPNPSVTDANGQIQFIAIDGVSEIVTYTALDVTDGNLPVPGSATVDFTGTTTSCVGPPPVAASGFAVTAFATGYFAQSFFYGNVNWNGCPGVSNPAFGPDGNLYVANFRTGDLFRLPPSGGAAPNGNQLSNLNLTLGQPTFGKDGRLYATHGATTGNFTTGDIVEIDPTTGAQIRVVAANLTCPNALSVDPLSGDLFFNDQCYGAGSDNPSLWRIHDPGGAATLSVYATLPNTPNGSMTFSPDGSLYVVVGYTSATPQLIKVAGTDKPAPPTQSVVQDIVPGYFVTMAEANPDGSAKSLLVVDSIGLELIDITTLPYAKTVLIDGQSVGSGVIGPDGCIYTQESDTIYKVTTSAGMCGFVPTNPAPALSLTPGTVAPAPAQGTSQTFTATFKNTTVPSGTPVMFYINGVNAQTRLARTDANGAATISYVGIVDGSDTVTAVATVGVTTFTSNAGHVTWAAGKHVSLMTLNLSPSVGTAGAPVTLIASLADITPTPNAVIAGVSVQLSLGGQSCSAITDAQGNASCSVTAPVGQSTITATFAGNAQFTSSAASQRFNVVSADGFTVPGAPTAGGATGGNGLISVAFSSPSSDGGSPITGYTATCTPTAGGASISAMGASSPIVVSGATNGVTYTCTVTAANAVGAGAPSAVSSAVTPSAGTAAAATAVPTLDRFAMMALSILLATIAFGALRRRSRQG